jgi:outer membrane protein assembly factor BamE (lipoprotein component of BamABCDE complex)
MTMHKVLERRSVLWSGDAVVPDQRERVRAAKARSINRKLGVVTAVMLLALSGCNRNPLTASKLSLDNYNKITTGMSKAQVEQILGPPLKSETKDMIIFKKTTYRYEDGTRFVQITFKNDEVDGKETNLGSQ